jgi:Ca2+-binding EF-hand superfamily protein
MLIFAKSTNQGRFRVFKRHLPFAAVIGLSLGAPALGTAALAQPAAKPAGTAPTRAALAKNIDANFKAVDTNGDGVLSAAELTAAESKGMQQRLTAVRAKIEAEFGKLDTNKDGMLSKAEFMAAAPQSAGNPNGAALLTQLDKNKDGKVTPDEYRAPVLARFDKIDTNHDGVISPTERQAVQAQQKR